MVVGLLGNKSTYSNRFILVFPKSENDVRLQATLGSKNPTGLPMGVVSKKITVYDKFYTTNITVVYWNENRVVCKYNDLKRRTSNSTITIEKGKFEKPDVEFIKEQTGKEVSVIKKEVVKKPDYIKIVDGLQSKVVGDYLYSNEWILRGETRNYDGEWSNDISPEEPDSFESLYDFLEQYKPELTALQLRYIQKNLIEYDERFDNDYYSKTTNGFYRINLKKLLEYID